MPLSLVELRANRSDCRPATFEHDHDAKASEFASGRSTGVL